MSRTTTNRYEFEGSETGSREIADAPDGYYLVTLVADHDSLRVATNPNVSGYLDRLKNTPITFLMTPGTKLHAKPSDSTPASISVVLAPIQLEFIIRALNAIACKVGA